MKATTTKHQRRLSCGEAGTVPAFLVGGHQRSLDRNLSPVQCHKRTVFASAQSDTSIRCHGLGICSAEFLISYPHQGRSLGPKTTKRMGAIAACDLHRERRHSVKYDFISDH